MHKNPDIPVLDERLSMIASFVDECDTIADIGSDHAYLPIYLLKKGKVKRAVITDINAGPLSNSKKTAFSYNVADRCEFLRGDGLTPLKNREIDSVMICGMGGELMMRMIKENADILKNTKSFVLQPQSGLAHLIKFLMQSGFCITDEAMVRQKHLFYRCFKLCNEGKSIYNSYDLSDLEFSTYLTQKKDNTMYEYLLFKLGVEEKILQNITESSCAVLPEKNLLRINKIKERLSEYEAV